MSVSDLLHRDVIPSTTRDVVAYIVEKGLYHWMEHVRNELGRKIARNELNRAQVEKIYALRYGCYKCCKRALKDGRLPL